MCKLLWTQTLVVSISPPQSSSSRWSYFTVGHVVVDVVVVAVDVVAVAVEVIVDIEVMIVEFR